MKSDDILVFDLFIFLIYTKAFAAIFSNLFQLNNKVYNFVDRIASVDLSRNFGTLGVELFTRKPNGLIVL